MTKDHSSELKKAFAQIKVEKAIKIEVGGDPVHACNNVMYPWINDLCYAGEWELIGYICEFLIDSDALHCCLSVLILTWREKTIIPNRTRLYEYLRDVYCPKHHKNPERLLANLQ